MLLFESFCYEIPPKRPMVSVSQNYLFLLNYLLTEKFLPTFLLSAVFFRVFFFFMLPKELWEAYSNRTVRQSVCASVRVSVRPSRFRVRSISPIFFEVGIPNLVCGYILGWGSVAYHFRVTETLTFDLVFLKIVSEAYLILFEVGILNLVCGCILG